MRPDGTILDREGYDEATGLLLVAPPDTPPIPDAPSRDDALAALALLKGLLAEFPFVDNVDRAVALSALITPVVRGAFPVAPMHCAKAPVAGSGKSYLFDVAGAIAIGQIMPVMAAGANEEELEKRLGAALLAGQPLICIDNVNGELKGDALCQTIERPLVEIRILGKSERVRIQARATTTFCTGNNITIVGDLCRRVITVTLDPKMESPETRQFKSNPVDLVLANRGAYVAAALTICRAYVVAGKPEAKRLSSFEGWSHTVRSALIWLGEPDVVDSMAASKSDDPELAELNEMLSSWAEVLGVGYRYRLPTAEVIKIIGEHQESLLSPSWPRLKAAIHAVASIGREPADAKRLGVWLRSRKGRLVGRYKFMNDADKNRMQTFWWVDNLDGVETEGLRRGRSHSNANDLIDGEPF
jgi:putative DNA primase/helicase